MWTSNTLPAVSRWRSDLFPWTLGTWADSLFGCPSMECPSLLPLWPRQGSHQATGQHRLTCTELLSGKKEYRGKITCWVAQMNECQEKLLCCKASAIASETVGRDFNQVEQSCPGWNLARTAENLSLQAEDDLKTCFLTGGFKNTQHCPAPVLLDIQVSFSQCLLSGGGSAIKSYFIFILNCRLSMLYQKLLLNAFLSSCCQQSTSL